MKFYLVTFSFLFLFLGCSGSKNHQDESTLLRSYRLIDSEKVDDAISLLSDELDLRDASSTEGYDASAEATDLRVTLASAYAKKSGITIREISQSYVLAKQISDLKIKNNSQVFQTENDQKISDLSKMILAQIKIAQTLTIIPKVSSEKVIYLNQAVKILNNVPNLSPADLVYSAILKVVLVRTLIESDNLKSFLPKAVDVNKQCVANFTQFRDYLLRATKILISGLDDLGKAMPEKKDEVMKNSKDVAELSANIASINAAGVVIYNVNKSTLIDIYKIFGMSSQEIHCDSNSQ